MPIWTGVQSMRLLKSFLESLGAQLLAALSLIVAVVLTVHALIGFRTTQSEITRLITTESRRTSDLVRRATHDGMLLNQLDEVQTMLERMGEGQDVLALRVFDKKGKIVLSANPTEIGQQLILTDETCSGCHGEARSSAKPASEDLTTLHTDSSADVLRHLSVIPNERSCASAECHAHPRDLAVLGVLGLEMSLAPAQAALASARRQLIATSVVLLLLTGLVTWWFVRRLVYLPTRRLRHAAMRVAAGDLDIRTEVRGNHELARLSRSFNSMIEDLAEARSEVQNWSRRLEAKVVDKTEELQRSQRQVLHMEKMASLGKLAATVAHELNNPLGGILTYARLVERELDDPTLSDEQRKEMKRYLVAIEQECSRSGDIVRNLLLFARQGGEEKAPVDLTEAMDRSLRLVQHHLEMSDLELKVERRVDDAIVHGNFGQLEQALVALFVNAVEAMSRVAEKHGGVLMVKLLPGMGDEVVIEVQDTGVGIPQEHRQRIFEPFFSTKGDQSGVGLGLSVVYGIVQNHGGSIDVESEPGRGTLFRLHFPVVRSARGQAIFSRESGVDS